MELMLSVKNGASSFVFPYLPQEIEIPVRTRKSEQFESIQGDLLTLGNFNLRQMSWGATFPKGKQPYCNNAYKGNPMEGVEFITKFISQGIPFRVVVTHGGRSLLNMACIIDDFKYLTDANGDISYTISLTEFPIPTIKR